jgi:hypothetical protein
MLLLHMDAVLFILRAYRFQHIAVGNEMEGELHREWPRAVLRIVDGQVDVQMPEVAPV